MLYPYKYATLEQRNVLRAYRIKGVEEGGIEGVEEGCIEGIEEGVKEGNYLALSLPLRALEGFIIDLALLTQCTQ